MKTILILAYLFPPVPGIGGRRWAKFSKYLTRNGFIVHVLTSENEQEEISPWLSDVIGNSKIVIHTVPDNYPSILNQTPKTISEKIRYRYSLFLQKIGTKGTPYDKTILNRNLWLKKAEEIIEKQKIDTIVASGAPFSLNFFAVLLKKKFPKIKVLNDFRDPWTWGSSYGFAGLHNDRLNFELTMEGQVMKYSDVVLVPAADMMKNLQSRYPDFAKKICLLPHGYDEDEMPKEFSKPKRKGIIFSGTMYEGLDEHITILCRTLKQNPEMEIDFFVPNVKYQELVNSFQIGTQVRFHSLLSSANYLAELSGKKYYLSLYPDKYKNFISTKFYEIIRMRVPIILVGENGELSEFIVKNGLGIHLFPNQMESILNDGILKDLTEKYNNYFDFSQYDIGFLSKEILIGKCIC